MDRLSLLLNRYSLSAGVFYAGQICGVHEFSSDAARGHVHLIRRGPVRLIGEQGERLDIEDPTLVFMPRPDLHRLLTDERAGADVLCATIQFGGGGRNPISDSLPHMVLVPLAELPGAEAMMALIDEEAFSKLCGQRAALDRLCELLLIRLLRYCLDRGLTRGGTLAGLADPRLAKALTRIHDNPTHAWDLNEMAHLAGMSRARFAAHFKIVVGDTPAEYLAGWRIALAQTLLKQGRAMKHVATEVGYGSQSALTRAFVRKVGQAPGAWLRGESVSNHDAV
ncbi:AraC family transcriptional regulator [Roseateles puraquae]|jgi:AraC-like DNA-binding protein|uniref:AraC family transcriptional regulator n=1 Tax=Roseateles puraquae TaxID=431059 RepID=A0A254N914_9BURK|nr:AraC family transcriptional regulator [Roseateles puraquae]MDG0854433.1 AraC family transcriptional regulator [Roseateles puraquae]OWR00831.1 AraC family transcriptional regulator [Roseateles puraquae]RTL38305.1 MAG: AraC family transcriptional regulator [Burkholderiales bacterium]